MSSRLECPQCKHEVRAPPENKYFPFCSDRCRTVDLGKWLGGEYRIAQRDAEEDEDGDVPPPESVH